MNKFSMLLAVLSLFLQGAVFADLEPCEISKLIPGDGEEADHFGYAVSLDGDYALVGAYQEDDADTNAGAAYIFRREGMAWIEEAKLVASDGTLYDWFGYAVSLSGDYALIGAPRDNDLEQDAGSAYIFRREGTAWFEEAKLVSSDLSARDGFGRSVSLDGDYALIGAWGDDDAGVESGAAYIFRREGIVWIEEAKLTASDGAADDFFGSSVSLSGDYALIGATGDGAAAFDGGAAYIFRREGTAWIEEAELIASDGEASDWFGYAVSLSGDYALIGARGDDDAGFWSGSAYIFRREGTAWIEEAKLIAGDGEAYAFFGFSVSITEDHALIGAYEASAVGYKSGSAYIFRRGSTGWMEAWKLTAGDLEAYERFGVSVSLSGDYALIGAYLGTHEGLRPGSAYVFGLSGAACGGMILAGPGPAYENWPLVRAFPPEQDAQHAYQFAAYGPQHHGVNVNCGDVDFDGFDEIITGAGPGAIYGPHVRGFRVDGTPLQGLSFLAYGTRKWGVKVAAGDMDNDGFDEIITGAGPGAVFGPHVRAFDYDGTSSVTPVPGVSFFAYATRKWGVNISGGDIDGDGFDEIITGPGPGAVFGPHIRGWDVDGGPASAIPSISFFAYLTRKYGAGVTCGNLDGDGFDEIVTGPGPGQMFGANVRGWDYDGIAVTPLPGCSFLAWQASEIRYGAKVFAMADLNREGRDELVVGCGPDPDAGTEVKVYRYNGAQVIGWFSLDAFPGMTHGTNVAAGRFLLP